MLIVHLVVSDRFGGVRENGAFKDRALAETRARLMGHHFGVIETAIMAAPPDRESVFAGYEYDSLLDEHAWCGLFATDAAARRAVGPLGHVIERKLA